MVSTSQGIVSVGTAKMIGFLLAICGNTLIACSLTLQKSAHNSISEYADEQQSPPRQDTASTADDRRRPRDDAYSHAPPCEASSKADLQLPPSVLSRQNPGAIDIEDPLTDETNTAAQSPAPAASGLHFLSNPTWWMGTFLMAAGEVGNFTAFAFAPASLVAPLGAWSVVLSAILANVFLHEVVSNSNLIGIALCVTGAFLIGTSGPDVSAAEAALDADAVSRLLVRLPFVVFILLTLTSTAFLIYLSHRTTLGQRYIFVYVGVSSLLGGVTVVCAKALSTFLRLTIEGNSQFGNWLPFALVVILALAILAQLRYLNLAMAQFGNAQVIPVYYVLFTTCAMSSGVIMYREFDALTVRNLPFFLGICSTMTGVFLVSKIAKRESRPPGSGDKGQSSKSRMVSAYEPVLPGSPMSSPRSTPWIEGNR